MIAARGPNRSDSGPATMVTGIRTRAATDSPSPIRVSGKDVVARKNSSENGRNIPVPTASIKKAPTSPGWLRALSANPAFLVTLVPLARPSAAYRHLPTILTNSTIRGWLGLAPG